MSFIDISDNEYDISEYDISESETDELYSPITPPDSPNNFYSQFHNINSNLNNFLILPSVPQTPPITLQTEDESQPESEADIEVETPGLNIIPQPASLSSTLPSPPLLPLNNNLMNEPVQLNDIFSLPQLIQNLQLFSNNTRGGTNQIIRRRATRISPFQLNQNDIMENVLQTSIQDIGGYKKVISDEGKEEIKFLEYEKNKFEEKKCTITQEEFEEKQVIAQLPCNHIFNKEGILYWLENESNACPVCRRELNYKEIKIEYEPENQEEEQNHNQEQESIENINSRFNNIIREINTRNQRQEEEQMQQAILNSLINQTSNQSQTSSSPPETPPPTPSSS